MDESGWLLTFMCELHAGVPDHPIMGWSDFDDEQRARIQSAYRAMIAAAPKPPAPPGEVEGLVKEARDGLRCFAYGPGAHMVKRLADKLEASHGGG